MEFEIKQLEPHHYEEVLVKWWNDWRWTPPTKEFLPDNGTGGLIVYDEDIPVCAGFIYVTNSQVSWVDWIISNKEYRKKPHRRNALELLLSTLTNVCERNGSKYVYALIKHKGLIDAYENIGYTKGDSYTHEMIKVF